MMHMGGMGGMSMAFPAPPMGGTGGLGGLTCMGLTVPPLMHGLNPTDGRVGVRGAGDHLPTPTLCSMGVSSLKNVGGGCCGHVPRACVLGTLLAGCSEGWCGIHVCGSPRLPRSPDHSTPLHGPTAQSGGSSGYLQNRFYPMLSSTEAVMLILEISVPLFNMLATSPFIHPWYHDTIIYYLISYHCIAQPCRCSWSRGNPHVQCPSPTRPHPRPCRGTVSLLSRSVGPCSVTLKGFL